MGRSEMGVAHCIYFTGPECVEIRTEELPPLPRNGLLVRSLKSAISAGTEMLLYKGHAPKELEADTTLSSLGGTLDFPLKYGYSVVGEVVESGSDAGPDWVGRRVFAFHPHQSFFVTSPEEVLVLPDDLDTDAALFLPNIETAVSLAQDGRPILGERIAVFGQGVVGLLLAGLLSRFPLGDLVAVEPRASRREISKEWGVAHPVQPQDLSNGGFDLCYELSGLPRTLNQALSVTGYGGRVVIGSWYGNRSAPLELGGSFHRSRITLLSSQVSTIDPSLRGRWDKKRRLETCLKLLPELKPQRLITHRLELTRAAQAYQLLNERQSDALQVVLTYQD